MELVTVVILVTAVLALVAYLGTWISATTQQRRGDPAEPAGPARTPGTSRRR